MSAIPHHTQLLQDALQEAAAQSAEQPVAPETLLRRRIVLCRQACMESPTWMLLATGLAAVVILLVLRPPFVVVYEHDTRHPWKGKLSTSWFSVFVASLVTVALAAAIPLATSGVSP